MTSANPVPPQRRLGLLIHDLQSGGAQRVMSILANAWVDAGCEVHLLTLERPGTIPFFHLDSRVRLCQLGGSARSEGIVARIANNAVRIHRLRGELIRIRPDLLLSFIDKTNVLALLSSFGLGLPVVVSERVDPASYDIGRVWDTLRAISYPFAAGLVVQVPSVRSFFPWFLQRRIRVIPNPVQRPGAVASAQEPGPRVIAAGRLTTYKGFDLLLEAFARVRSRYPEWRLDILGEGDERPALAAQADRLGISGCFRLMGNRPDILPQMRGADIFVLSSRAEGFPNVLCEAMAAGMAVISFDCPTGPAEIIQPGVDGLLVPAQDVTALADALDKLMGNAGLRARLASRAPEVMDRFSEEAIVGQWDTCFRELAAPRSLKPKDV
jgi:glycosyltransferase involved in cell wall biosynthesis